MNHALAVTKKTFLVQSPDQPRSKPIAITIDPEFEALIAPLSAEERNQLKDNIGDLHELRDPLVVWENPQTEELILLDGHHRQSILAELYEENGEKPGTPLECRIDVITRSSLPQIIDRDAALLWIEENQVGRRNLSDDQRAVIWDSIRERRSAIEKTRRAFNASAAKYMKEALSAKTTDKQSEAKSETKRDTRKEVAAESGLPESKLRAVHQLKESNPEIVQEVRAGRTTLRAAKKEVKAAHVPLASTEGMSPDMVQSNTYKNWKIIDTADNTFRLKVSVPILKIKHVFTDHDRNALIRLRVGLQATINHISQLLESENTSPSEADPKSFNIGDYYLGEKGRLFQRAKGGQTAWRSEDKDKGWSGCWDLVTGIRKHEKGALISKEEAERRFPDAFADKVSA